MGTGVSLKPSISHGHGVRTSKSPSVSVRYSRKSQLRVSEDLQRLSIAETNFGDRRLVYMSSWCYCDEFLAVDNLTRTYFLVGAIEDSYRDLKDVKTAV